MPSIALSPSGQLFIEGAEGDLSLKEAFEKGCGNGLLLLEASTEVFSEDIAFSYWKDFARLFLVSFAATPDLEGRDLAKDPVCLDLAAEDLHRFLLTVPPMKGAEYIHEDRLRGLWAEISLAIHAQILDSGQGVDKYFASRHFRLNLLGKVCLHLAENKNSTEHPFAFLVTYAHRISTEGKAQHLPLHRAVSEYSAPNQRSTFLRLLVPLQKASKESAFLSELIRSGEIYQTLLWQPKEAYQFLKDIPIFEKSGIAVRVPNWWKPKQAHGPQISIRLGEKKAAGLGLDALVDFSMSVVLNDQDLSQKEIQDLLSSSENLVFFKGQWVEVDREKFLDLMTRWKSAAQSIGKTMSFGEALRLQAGMLGPIEDGLPLQDHASTRILCGEWFSKVLATLKSSEAGPKFGKILETFLKAQLRPYQREGVIWLNRLNQLRLGGILADDMGLGKTIQVISLLLLRKHQAAGDFKCLLVLPLSLLGNWKAELSKFAPSLKIWIAHPSGDGSEPPGLHDFDIVLTSYGSLCRKDQWIRSTSWNLVIADEAQAIKNPGAKQTKALKALHAEHRLALTGTPVENHLSDLWSLFDFISPGLLGSVKDFADFMKRKSSDKTGSYSKLRSLVRPYILRRMKTDKTVIQDLPEKTELKSFCQLSKGQAALYQKSVESLSREVHQLDGIKRRGVILSYLMRFKQICNHPSQFVKDACFYEKDSGKFQRLREICEVIADKQEKVLVFTQFREMTGPLTQFLEEVFKRPGLTLSGEISVKMRNQRVEEFQQDNGPPFFVLSLKAGGSGLNLTAASHVIHFDRWWNPAVENQATDRAFRIGQKKNVLVHKFVCKGTLEEKIDALLESKVSLSKEILEEGGAPLLTELTNDELLKVVSLDINAALEEK